MYINPVLVGVIGTILTEIVLTILVLIVIGRKNNDDDK